MFPRPRPLRLERKRRNTRSLRAWQLGLKKPRKTLCGERWQRQRTASPSDCTPAEGWINPKSRSSLMMMINGYFMHPQIHVRFPDIRCSCCWKYFALMCCPFLMSNSESRKGAYQLRLLILLARLLDLWVKKKWSDLKLATQRQRSTVTRVCLCVLRQGSPAWLLNILSISTKSRKSMDKCKWINADSCMETVVRTFPLLKKGPCAIISSLWTCPFAFSVISGSPAWGTQY